MLAAVLGALLWDFYQGFVMITRLRDNIIFQWERLNQYKKQKQMSKKQKLSNEDGVAPTSKTMNIMFN